MGVVFLNSLKYYHLRHRQTQTEELVCAGLHVSDPDRAVQIRFREGILEQHDTPHQPIRDLDQ